MSAQTDLIKTIIRSLSQERFNEAVAIFERAYRGNEIVFVDGHGDGGCDIKRFKNGKELKECVQVTVNKTNLKKKLFDDLVKVQRLITHFRYSPSFDFYCSEVLADDKINDYREYAKNEHGIELHIYDGNRLSGLECPKLQEYLFDLIKLGPVSFPLVDLNDYLSMQLAWTRKQHPSFRLMEIDDGLFPDGIPELHSIKAVNDANETKTVSEIVADSWGREKNHLMIEGEGGIGKTVTLLSLPDKFVPHAVPAVYVQLHKLKGVCESETLQDYCKSQIFFDDELLFKHFDARTKQPWKDGPQVLLLLDGFNEITPERRFSIGEDINRWADRPGVQIITSSRFDIHSYVPLGGGYSQVHLQPLNRAAIKDYLTRWNIPFPRTKSQWDIITYPLMLSLYVQTKNAMVDRDRRIQYYKASNSSGDIIWNYLQRELWRYRQHNSDVAKCVLAAEYIAPYIAWKMQKESVFILDEDCFLDYLDEAYDSVSKLEEKQLLPHIRRVLRITNCPFPDRSAIQSFLEEQLRLFIRNDTTYALMHQQFRDALAALHLINLSYASTELPEEWKTPVDYYVMEFVSDLATLEEANCLWERNRVMKPHEDAATINMLELQKRKRNSDFSDLNFSGLDLRSISLFPYRIPGSSNLRLPIDGDKNAKLLLSNKTFYPESHSRKITVVALSPDGKKCVSGSNDQTLRIWDPNTGRCLRTLEGHTGSILTLGITPDGKRCVSGSDDHTLRIWDLNSGQCLRTLKGHEGSVYTLGITHDGKKCVSGADDNTFLIWDLDTGQFRRTLEGDNMGISTLCVTPDGKKGVTESYDRILRIWDLESGKCLQMLKGYSGSIRTFGITPDGKKCVNGSDDGTLLIWDLNTGQFLQTRERHKGSILALGITPDGKKCVSGSKDSILRFWDLDTGECIRTLAGHNNWIKTLVISPDSKKCLSGSDDHTLRIWDLDTGKCLQTLGGHNGSIRALCISLDGKKCVSGSYGQTIQIWDLESGQCLGTLEGHNGSIRALGITPDGRKCVSGSSDRTLRIWDLESGQCLRTLKGHEGSIETLGITPDGKKCVSGSDDHTLLIWDLEYGQCLGTLKGHEGSIETLGITRDGKKCVSGSDDQTLRIWDLESGQCLGTLEGHNGSIRALGITPDGKKCVIGSSNSAHRNWDLDTQEGETPCTPSSNITLRIWDLESRQCVGTLEGHEGSINTLGITPDGTKCVSGSSDSKLRIWDIHTGKLLQRLKGHNDVIRTLGITPDGKKCVSGSWDKTLRLWDLETYQSIIIEVLPIFLKGCNFTQSSITPADLVNTLWQNGAIVDL